MRRLTLLAVVALAVAVLLPASGLAGAGGTNRPFQESASGIVTVNILTGQAHAVGTGIGSHIGLCTVEDDLQFADGGATWTSSGWTGTAANGDQISMTGSGSSTAMGSTGTYTVTGGTGRFEGATGTVISTTTNTLVSIVGATATYSWEGTLVGTLSY